MPLYVLRCPTHGDFEVLCSWRGWPSRCDRCGQLVERQLTSAGVRFKGPGFYATDYGRGDE